MPSLLSSSLNASVIFCPRRAPRFQPGPAGDVHAQVEDIHARFRFRERHRANRLDHADRRMKLGHQSPGRCMRLHGGGPPGVIVSGLVPAWLFPPCIIGLAAADAVEDDRTGRMLPGGVRDDEVPRAVAVFDIDSQQELGRSDPGGVVEAPDVHRGRIVPAAAEHRRRSRFGRPPAVS